MAGDADTGGTVLALQLAHLLRLRARRAGHDLSVKALLDTLGGIQETVLIYPPPADDPKPAA